MKVLMVNKFLHPNGGSETYIFKIGEHLTNLGHCVEYFGMEHENRVVGNTANVYINNMDFHSGKLQKLLYPFKIIYSLEARKKIRVILEQFQPDVIHLNNINFQITPAIIDEIRKWDKKMGHKVAIIFTAHDYQWVCPNHMMKIPSTGNLCFACKGGAFNQCIKHNCIHNSKVKSILGALEGYFYKMRNIYEEVDQIICPSEFLNQQLSTNSVLQKKTITMHNFLQEPIVENQETENGEGRNIQPYVLYFGRYAEEKGIHTLVQVCKKLPHIPFVFAGGGPLEDLVNDCENVTNLGFLGEQELKDYVKHAQFSIFPSEWYENCPFTVMESQMYGTPVIAANIGGVPELLQDGITGELYESGNVEMLQQRIETLWNDQEKIEKYKENCKHISFDTVETYCDKLLEIYNKHC